MKPREQKFVFALVLIALASVIAVGGLLATKRYREWQEERWHYVSREELESKKEIKTPPVLVLRGTVDGRDFEIVMRGFTNYFRRETWGASENRRNFLGERKPGGYAVEIRTAKFYGERQQQWRARRGSGGGGGVEVYRDDIVPGRSLWNSRGFVGVSYNYERRLCILSSQLNPLRWEEDWKGLIQKGEIRIPRTIIWTLRGRSYSGEWSKPSRVFKIRSFKFQNEPTADWFEDRVKEYFPPTWIFEPDTNSLTESATGVITNK